MNSPFMCMAMDIARALMDMDPYMAREFGSGMRIPDRNQRSSLFRWPMIGRRPFDERQLVSHNHSSKDIKPSSIGKQGFQVSMDVQQFKPSELTVKVVNRTIVVEGKHEEREDDLGYISRHFIRRYAVPKDYDVDKIMSTLSSDGVLTVSVPKPPSENKNEKIVPIQQTGPAHLNIKDNQEETKESKTPSGDKANKVACSPKK